MTPVKSSWIKGVDYDSAKKALTVHLKNGEVYTYHDVPERKHIDMLAADSVGAFVTKHIKPHHTHRKVK